jgi:hypothetical protein
MGPRLTALHPRATPVSETLLIMTEFNTGEIVLMVSKAQHDALVHAAEQVIAHIGESDEQDCKLLLDLAVAVDQMRRKW